MFSASDYDKLQQIMDESPQKKELLTRLLESQQMTISTISHEIRNPLTLVYSTVQLIESQHPEVLTYKHWDGMKADIEYMTHLLEELSAYNNGWRLNVDLIETNTFLKTLALSFAASIADTEIEFTSKIEPDLPTIQGDALKLRQVLLNLLRNARDAVRTYAYTPEQSANSVLYHPAIQLDARLCCSHTGPTDSRSATSSGTDFDALLISVTDNGCGIPAKDIEDIFEPFVTHKSDGTGLGLAIAKRITAAHSGILTASSTPGIRTVFRLMLPVKQDTQQKSR